MKNKPFKIKIEGLANRPVVWAAKQKDGNFLLTEDASKVEAYTDEQKAFVDRKLLLQKLKGQKVTVTFDWDS